MTTDRGSRHSRRFASALVVATAGLALAFGSGCPGDSDSDSEPLVELGGCPSGPVEVGSTVLLDAPAGDGSPADFEVEVTPEVAGVTVTGPNADGKFEVTSTVPTEVTVGITFPVEDEVDLEDTQFETEICTIEFVAPGSICTDDSDCEPGFSCDQESGECVEDAEGCLEDSDCGDGEFCDEGTCTDAVAGCTLSACDGEDGLFSGNVFGDLDCAGASAIGTLGVPVECSGPGGATASTTSECSFAGAGACSSAFDVQVFDQGDWTCRAGSEGTSPLGTVAIQTNSCAGTVE